MKWINEDELEMNATTMTTITKTTADEIAAAIQAAGIQVPGAAMKAIIAAFKKAERADNASSVGRSKTPISTQAQVEKAAPGVHHVKGETGLYLKKGEGDAGSWFRRYWFGGKRREMGLGAIGGPRAVSLLEARKRASEFDVQRNAGHDPIELKRATKAEASAKIAATAAAADTWVFSKATDEYLKSHASSWKHPRARALWVNPLIKYAYPVIGGMQLDVIRVEHIDAVMSAAVDGKAPLQAPRIRLRIEQILNAAIAKGKRNAELPNPAGVKLVKAIRPTKTKGASKHFRRLELDHAPAAFQRLQERAQASTALSALAFMIATAARPSEALEARWDQIDLDAKIWLNPSSKTDKPLPAPLSSIALAVLDRQESIRSGDMVFPGRGGSPVSYATFSAAARDIGFDLGSPHSWRSIFADAVSEKLGVSRETREAALGHSLGKVEEAYRRETGVEARRVAMEAYADWLLGRGADNVVAFKAGA
jgi:integrase